MDWTEQAQEMANNWTEMQKKLMDTYFESVSEMSKSPSEKLWDQTIATGKQAIANTLNAQKDWLNTWVENLKAIDGMPVQATESAEQYRQLSVNWLDTQNKLWDSWFEMLRKFDMSSYSGMGSGAATNPFQAWQESSTKIMEAQVAWMNSWMSAFRSPKNDE